MKRAFGLLCLAVAVPVVAAACGRADLDLPPPYQAGPGTDAAALPDGAADARPDGTADATPDGTADATPDAPIPDSGPDSFVPDAGCSPATCPTGCCSVDGACIVDKTAAACGSGGNACLVCPAAAVCGTDGKCYDVNDCNPNTCNGCCIGNLCVGGNDTTACGANGAECTNCAGANQVCEANACVAGAPKCSAANCNGCCSGDVCVVGTDPLKCGANGQACTACGAAQVCSSNGPQAGGACEAQNPQCNPGNCNGCCDGNRCRQGANQRACGQAGVACRDCAAEGSTCDLQANPRTCVAAPNACPTQYLACPAGTVTPTLPLQKGQCTTANLTALAAACGQGPDGAACVAARNALPAACSACIAPFAVPFQDLTGLFACVAPYLDAACNRSTGCAADCSTASCDACATPQQEQQCRQQSTNGQCQPYYQQAQCTFTAFLGQGSFCNPQTYGNYGGWLAAVGKQYCNAP